MSENNYEEDDFFGIKYMDQVNVPKHYQPKRSIPKLSDEHDETPIKEPRNSRPMKDRSRAKYVDQMSTLKGSRRRPKTGTEFIDESFFPELSENDDEDFESDHQFQESSKEFIKLHTSARHETMVRNESVGSRVMPQTSRPKLSDKREMATRRTLSSKPVKDSSRGKYADQMSTPNEPRKRSRSGTDFIDQSFFPDMSENDYNEDFELDEDEFNRPKKMPRRPKPKKTLVDEVEEQIPLTAMSDFIIPTGGLQALYSLIDPVWKMSRDELIKMMVDRVIYEDDDLIAFDKPYQMPYSSGPKSFDLLLQDIKKIVAPKIDRLHLIKSTDKCVPGILLFAKSGNSQKKYKDAYNDGLFEMKYRCIVKGIPKIPEARINIPLKRFQHGRDIEYRPFIEGSKLKQFQEVVNPETEYKVINSDEKNFVSLLSIRLKKEFTHQIRSHLGYGIGHPIIGDPKYGKRFPLQSPHQKEVLLIPFKPPKMVLKPSSSNNVFVSAPLSPSTFSKLRNWDEKPWNVREKFAKQTHSFLHISDECSIVLVIRPKSPYYEIDYKWEERLSNLLQKYLNLESSMWNLSTFGGAFSSMGDFFEDFAHRAFQVSMKQRKIALEIGDPILISRTNIYIALSLAQLRNFSAARQILKGEYQIAKQLNSPFLLNCAHGTWVKIRQIYKASKNNE